MQTNRQKTNTMTAINPHTHARTKRRCKEGRQAGRSIERADHSSKYRSEGHQNAEKVEWMHTDAHTLAHIETVKSDASGKWPHNAACISNKNERRKASSAQPMAKAATMLQPLLTGASTATSQVVRQPKKSSNEGNLFASPSNCVCVCVRVRNDRGRGEDTQWELRPLLLFNSNYSILITCEWVHVYTMCVCVITLFVGKRAACEPIRAI